MRNRATMKIQSQLRVPKRGRRSPRPRANVLRCVTFLAPNLFWLYDYVARRLADAIGQRAKLVVGRSYAELPAADVAFVCGLPYVEATDAGRAAVEPLAAPVLRGERYGGRLIYFSDVIVRHDSPFQ